MLEASGIFTPAAIAHFRQGVPSPVMENDTNQCELICIDIMHAITPSCMHKNQYSVAVLPTRISKNRK